MFELLDINSISDNEYSRYYSLMSREKKARVDAFRFIADKKRNVCGEILSRRMISSFCSIPAEDLIFETDSRGKPFAVNAEAEFSISHSGDLVICSVEKYPTGADIEKKRRVEDRLIDYVCTDAERLYVYGTGGSDERALRFLEIWTAKEAYFKCIGTGITDLKSICVLDDDIKSKTRTFQIGDYTVSIFNLIK